MKLMVAEYILEKDEVILLEKKYDFAFAPPLW